jgi:hypothetical protein
MFIVEFNLERKSAADITGFEHFIFFYTRHHHYTCDINYNIGAPRKLKSEQVSQLFKNRPVGIHPRHNQAFEILNNQTTSLSNYKGIMVVDANDEFKDKINEMTIFFQGIVSTENLSPLNLDFAWYHASILTSDKPQEYFKETQGIVRPVQNKDLTYDGPQAEGTYTYALTNEFLRYSISEYFLSGCNSFNYNKYINFVKEYAITKIRTSLEKVTTNNQLSFCKYETTEGKQTTLAVIDISDNSQESCISLGGTPYSESEIAEKLCSSNPGFVFYDHEVFKITCDNYQDLLDFNRTHITDIIITWYNHTEIM